jgi:prefoldin alpha subunit
LSTVTQKPAENEQRARKLILSIQALEDEMVHGQSNLQMIEVQAQRLEETASAVTELKKHAPGDEVMVSLGAGVHLQVKLVNASRVVAAMGAGVAAERNLDDALALFKKQQEQLADIAKRQEEQLQTYQSQIDGMRNQLSQLLQQK